MPSADAEPVRTLPAGTTRADFYTGTYRISADVFTGDRRLLDAVRDVTRQYLDIRHFVVTPVAGGGHSVEYAEGLLSKSDIEWVVIHAEPPRAEARHYRYVKKTPVRVALVLGAHRIDGTVFVDSGSFDPAASFLRGVAKSAEQFMAVASAQVTTVAGNTEEFELAIVNRAAVTVFTTLS